MLNINTYLFATESVVIILSQFDISCKFLSRISSQNVCRTQQSIVSPLLKEQKSSNLNIFKMFK